MNEWASSKLKLYELYCPVHMLEIPFNYATKVNKLFQSVGTLKSITGKKYGILNEKTNLDVEALFCSG